MALPLPAGRITSLQWSGKNGAVAIGHVDSSEHTSVIQLLQPSNPQDLTQLQLPISGKLWRYQVFNVVLDACA